MWFNPFALASAAPTVALAELLILFADSIRREYFGESGKPAQIVEGMTRLWLDQVYVYDREVKVERIPCF